MVKSLDRKNNMSAYRGNILSVENNSRYLFLISDEINKTKKANAHNFFVLGGTVPFFVNGTRRCLANASRRSHG